MCSVRVRKFTGLMRNQVLPLSSVVEIQNFPLLSTRSTTMACSLFRVVFAQGGGAKADADGRHGRPAGGFEVRMLRNQRIKMRRLADVVVDPVANLAAAVALEAHPDFEAAKAASCSKL